MLNTRLKKKKEKKEDTLNVKLKPPVGGYITASHS